MTGIYEITNFPKQLSIKCPSCGKCATFEFALENQIILRKDRSYFEQHDKFDFHQCKDSNGNTNCIALWFAPLRGSLDNVKDLPDGIKASDWGTANTSGAIVCPNCHLRKKHTLQWINDAYYAISIKGDILWAYNRESAIDLRDFIKSEDRRSREYRWEYFLRHVPTKFKRHNVQKTVINQINKRLQNG